MARAHLYEGDTELRQANFLEALDALADLFMAQQPGAQINNWQAASLIRLLSIESRGLLLKPSSPFEIPEDAAND